MNSLAGVNEHTKKDLRNGGFFTSIYSLYFPTLGLFNVKLERSII